MIFLDMDLKVCLLVIGVVVGSYGHSLRSGGCPKVKILKDFDMDRFSGDWYVMKRFNPVFKCTKISIEQDQDGNYTVTETRRPFSMHFRRSKNHPRRPRKLTFLRDDTKSLFKVQRTFPRFSLKTFGVVDTDYDSYAVVWGCDPFIFSSIQNADVLSRYRDMSPDMIKKARNALLEMGVNLRPMKSVDHGRCEEKDGVETDVDNYGSNMEVDVE